MSSRHLLLIEDEPAIHAAVQMVLAPAGWSCVAAASAAQGRKWLTQREFACILVDLGLPDGNGLDLVELAAQLCPTTPVLVLTTATAWTCVEAALRAGARGYLLKEDLATRLVPALQEMGRGVVLSSRVAEQVVHAALGPPPGQLPEIPSDDGQLHLSSREREVLRWLVAGLTYQQMAEAGGVSLNTVRSHIRSLYEKLHVHSRAQAQIAARRVDNVAPGRA